MKESPVDISVIIVNYKVKEYIANLLNSLYKGSKGFNLEVFVVDNNSGDDSVSYLKERYPQVTYIANTENKGFGVANNQAIKKASGAYTLIINPDTLISEDTLSTLVSHMEENQQCGAAGCKILNPDGTFAPESRRSVPTIWSAACKVFGLNYLFPDRKVFGKYYLSWMDDDEQAQIPVLSGSFMFWRTKLLKELKGFDERFFMYGEDIDLCYRVQQTDYHIDYVPSTSIIHYKGESTKGGDLRYIRIFNKALYQFFDKHYSSRYSFLFKIFIYLAIWVRTLLSFAGSYLKRSKIILADLLILNTSLAVGFILRYGLQGVNILIPDGVKYLWINALSTLLYLVSGSMLGMFKTKRDSLSTTLKALTMTYAGVVIITFFVRDLAYTRLGLGIAFILGVISFISFRLFRANSSVSGEHIKGKLRNSRVIIVGENEMAADIINKIHSRPDWTYEVIGVVGKELEREDSENYLGTITQLKDLVKAYHPDQVFFALNSISYKQMLKEISYLQKEEVVFKLIPDSMDFILGKSKVEYLEAIPLVEVEFDYSKPLNKMLKRVLDLSIAIPTWLLLVVITWPSFLAGGKKVNIKGLSFYADVSANRWKNWCRIFGYVITGKLSLVGAPATKEYEKSTQTSKKGVTGIIQISENRIQTRDDEESFELYYLQNYSIWMDIDILMKTLFNGPSPIQTLSDVEQQMS
ncbi:MAG: glycosyltransferase [Balneolaceae bacterium]|nr:glycosyltransferase [Balneolaceae bacterium]